MEVAKLSAPPNLEVRYVSCNESAKQRCLSSELEETRVSFPDPTLRDTPTPPGKGLEDRLGVTRIRAHGSMDGSGSY